MKKKEIEVREKRNESHTHVHSAVTQLIVYSKQKERFKKKNTQLEREKTHRQEK